MGKLNVVAEAGSHALLMTREFDAPRALVFKAFTDPELIPRWWGPRRMTTTVETMDVRMGGIWRYIQHDTDGSEIAFRGVYHHIVVPEQLIYTFEWEGMPGHVLLETVTFTDLGTKTLMTDALVFQTIEDRDNTVKSGMEHGTAESMDRIEELLNTL